MASRFVKRAPGVLMKGRINGKGAAFISSYPDTGESGETYDMEVSPSTLTPEINAED